MPYAAGQASSGSDVWDIIQAWENQVGADGAGSGPAVPGPAPIMDLAGAGRPGVGLWSPQLRATTVGLVFTITLVAFEALAVITILPVVSHDLGGIGLYGWVMSAFSLGALLGIIVGGQEADRRGPGGPLALGLLLFAAGLALGGLAPTMGVLVVARGIQGVGAGVIPPVVYASVGRRYPEALRPRVFAILSTAWVLPALLGPGVSAFVAVQIGWRWVFLGLLPLVCLAGVIMMRPLRGIDRPRQQEVMPGRTVDALRVAIGAGLIIAGSGSRHPLTAPVALIAGLAIGLPALLRVLPRGTFRAKHGLPAAVLVRGLLTFAFFGADTFLPLALTSARGQSPAVAGIAVTCASVAWAAGSWIQERMAMAWGARRLVITGFSVLLAGIAIAGLVLIPSAPIASAIAGWLIAGFGIGIAYAQITVAVLAAAPGGQEGASSASMQLSDNLGVAMGAGLGGVAVAAGAALGWPPQIGIAIAFGLALAVGSAGVVASRRLAGRGAVVDVI